MLYVEYKTKLKPNDVEYKTKLKPSNFSNE